MVLDRVTPVALLQMARLESRGPFIRQTILLILSRSATIRDLKRA